MSNKKFCMNRVTWNIQIRTTFLDIKHFIDQVIELVLALSTCKLFSNFISCYFSFPFSSWSCSFFYFVFVSFSSSSLSFFSLSFFISMVSFCSLFPPSPLHPTLNFKIPKVGRWTFIGAVGWQEKVLERLLKRFIRMQCCEFVYYPTYRYHSKIVKRTLIDWTWQRLFHSSTLMNSYRKQKSANPN